MEVPDREICYGPPSALWRDDSADSVPTETCVMHRSYRRFLPRSKVIEKAFKSDHSHFVWKFEVIQTQSIRKRSQS
jgi:hypothetical protein